MGDRYQKLLWAKPARARHSRDQLRRRNPRVVPVRPHSGIGSRHLLSPPHALPPGQTFPSPERPSSLATTTLEVPRSGQSSSRFPGLNREFLPAACARGSWSRESRVAAGSAAFGTRSAPARHRGEQRSTLATATPAPPLQPAAAPRRDWGAGDPAVCPAQPAPRPGSCYRLGREAAPGAAPAPCWRSVAPSARAAAHTLRAAPPRFC